MAKVELRGYSDLRRALKRFAPDLDKQLKTELAAALKPVVTQARGFVPANSDIMRGWQPRAFSEARFPFYDSSTIKKGIVYKTTPSKANANGFTSMARIINQSAAGAIYDHAGRHTAGRFVANLNVSGGGEQPRVIDKAVEKNKPAVQAEVQLVIANVEAKTNKQLKQRYK